MQTLVNYLLISDKLDDSRLEASQSYAESSDFSLDYRVPANLAILVYNIITINIRGGDSVFVIATTPTYLFSPSTAGTSDTQTKFSAAIFIWISVDLSLSSHLLVYKRIKITTLMLHCTEPIKKHYANIHRSLVWKKKSQRQGIALVQ